MFDHAAWTLVNRERSIRMKAATWVQVVWTASATRDAKNRQIKLNRPAGWPVVAAAGLEPALENLEADFKSAVSTNFTTRPGYNSGFGERRLAPVFVRGKGLCAIGIYGLPGPVHQRVGIVQAGVGGGVEFLHHDLFALFLIGEGRAAFGD